MCHQGKKEHTEETMTELASTTAVTGAGPLPSNKLAEAFRNSSVHAWEKRGTDTAELRQLKGAVPGSSMEPSDQARETGAQFASYQPYLRHLRAPESEKQLHHIDPETGMLVRQPLANSGAVGNGPYPAPRPHLGDRP